MEGDRLLLLPRLGFGRPCRLAPCLDSLASSARSCRRLIDLASCCWLALALASRAIVLSFSCCSDWDFDSSSVLASFRFLNLCWLVYSSWVLCCLRKSYCFCQYFSSP